MTSAVIIFLREVLEAMLLVSLLMATSAAQGIQRRWIIVGVLAGLVGAGCYAWQFDSISDAFDGVGQEITNGTMLYAISAAIMCYILLIFIRYRFQRHVEPTIATSIVLMLTITGLAVTREGAELYIYISGYLLLPDQSQPILLGGALGAGLGLSIGALIYFAMTMIAPDRRILVGGLLLVPVAAGMSSQATNYLMQADIISSQLPLWDSSAIVQEGTVVGELLYAFFSYEATPTFIQVAIYGLCLLVTLCGIAGIFYFSRKQTSGERA